MSKEALAAQGPRLEVFRRVQVQRRWDKGKVYSLHEPDVACIAKGKAHKKYEFGCKVSVAWTKTSGVIVGAKAFVGNPFDGHTLDAALNQVETITGRRPLRAATDKGYRGRRMVGATEILLPGRPKAKATAHQRRIARHRFRRRAGIEGVISHLKHDYRMLRNYLKGTLGDAINALLACAAYNFKKLLRRLGDFFAFPAWLTFRRLQVHTLGLAA
jgi:IS5 family transposase